MKLPSNTELLTVEQFAERLHLSRTTIFDWMQKLILVNGCHYIKIRHVIRFVWTDNIIDQLLEASANYVQKDIPVKPRSVPMHRKKSKLIDLDY